MTSASDEQKSNSVPAGAAAFRQINGRPIMWTGRGFTHAVEGADMHPGVRLLWTVCEIDVPAGRAFLPGDNDKVDCPACLSKAEA